MALLDFFKKPKLSLQKKEAPKVMINRTSPYSAHSNKDYKALAREGYSDNSIVHRCVQLIANSSSAVDLCLYQGEEKLESHELLTLLDRPNPLQSGVEFFSSLYAYLMISGNSYILRDTETFTPPNEMYLLRPDRMKVKSNTSMIPEAYCYIIDGVTIKEYKVDGTNGQSQIKQIKLYNPLDDFYGLSPLKASAYNIDQHNLAGLHNVALLKNGCTPSGMLKFEPTDETGSSTTLTDSQRAQLLEDLEMRFQGANNSGRPLLLEGNFEYTQLGLNPKDMDFLELSNLSAREIALAFGVPAQLIGIPEANTYSNMETARLGFYEETIIPLLHRVESDLNEYLTVLYDGNLRLKYDIDSIPAMAEKTKQVYENIIGGVNAGILTRNEARAKLGLEAVEGGDELYVNSNQFPIGETEDDDSNPDSSDEDEKMYELIYGTKEEVGDDEFTTEAEAQERADEIGCVGTHSHDTPKGKIYMPCRTHEDYVNALANTDKALSDIDLTPTESMSEEAKKGLAWRKEFNRGGTQVGVTRANQLVNKQNLSVDTVLRMYSFFSRHEVDKRAEGFRPGEKGYPSAGRIAWALWGGDAGFSWSTKKRNQIQREREKSFNELELKVAGVRGSTLKALEGKVKEHNDKYGDKKGKRVTVGMLARVFKRGVGAYRNNPSSVRPSVRRQGGEDQWAMARVNTFLTAVRTGRFPGGKFDLDLLPKEHPLSSKD
jgi:HK97 family phage portal protein